MCVTHCPNSCCCIQYWWNNSAFCCTSRINKFQGYKPLTADKLNTLRSRLISLNLLIIDEVSMVGSNTLLKIHKRLQETKGAFADQTFGGVRLLAVGDLYQLPPVCQPPIFDLVTDGYIRLQKVDHSGKMNLLSLNLQK